MSPIIQRIGESVKIRTSGVLDRQAAIYRDVHAVEEAGGREDDREGHIGDFFRDAVAAQWHAAFGVDGLVFFGDAGGDAGADGAGADAVDGDVHVFLAAQVAGEAAGEADHAVLGRDIG